MTLTVLGRILFTNGVITVLGGMTLSVLGTILFTNGVIWDDIICSRYNFIY